MWEISVGDIKSLYAMKSVPPKDLGFLEPKVSEILNTSSPQFLSITRCLRSECRSLKSTRRRCLFELTRTNYAFYKHLRTHIHDLEKYDKQACIHGFIIIL